MTTLSLLSHCSYVRFQFKVKQELCASDCLSGWPCIAGENQLLKSRLRFDNQQEFSSEVFKKISTSVRSLKLEYYAICEMFCLWAHNVNVLLVLLN